LLGCFTNGALLTNDCAVSIYFFSLVADVRHPNIERFSYCRFLVFSTVALFLR